jgi:hypothetical protein
LRPAERASDRLAEPELGAKAPAAGHRDEFERARPQFRSNIVEDQIDVAVRADHPRQIFAQDRPGGGEHDRLDAAHPFAPAQFRRQVLELDIEGDLGFGAPAHR